MAQAVYPCIYVKYMYLSENGIYYYDKNVHINICQKLEYFIHWIYKQMWQTCLSIINIFFNHML